MNASTLVAHALADALAVVLPLECAGCGLPDVELCAECGLALAPVVRRHDVEGSVVWSGTPFEGAAARVIRAVKEEGRTRLARTLAPALAAAAVSVPDAIVVPVPTSRASFRRRGFHVVELVARRAGLPTRRLLRYARQPRDQRGLDVEGRRRNLAGSMIARSTESRRVLVVDDVLTTGATLAEAVRALRAAGCDVAGAATIAATPRRSHIRWPKDDTPETHR